MTTSRISFKGLPKRIPPRQSSAYISLCIRFLKRIQTHYFLAQSKSPYNCFYVRTDFGTKVLFQGFSNDLSDYFYIFRALGINSYYSGINDGPIDYGYCNNLPCLDDYDCTFSTYCSGLISKYEVLLERYTGVERLRFL